MRTAINIVSILKEVAADLESHSEELRQLDAIIGDGDLGVTAEFREGAWQPGAMDIILVTRAIRYLNRPLLSINPYSIPKQYRYSW